MSTRPIPSLSPIDRLDQDKALYSAADRRLNINDSNVSVDIREISMSVACLVEHSWSAEKDNTYRFDAPTLKDRVKKTYNKSLSKRELFRKEPSLGNSTVFLVGPKLVLTAAHCVFASQRVKAGVTSTFKVIFGFQMPITTPVEVQKDKVYSIDCVLDHSRTDGKGDWALLRLDREVTGTKPLEIDFVNEMIDQQDIYMLGHPYGLPMKYTAGEIKPSSASETLQASVDSFAGNSGSPLFNSKNRKVVGMLISGRLDWNTSGKHVKAYHYPSDGNEFEKCQKMSSLPKRLIKEINPAQVERQKGADTLWDKISRLFKEDKTLEAVETFEASSEAKLDCKLYDIALFLQTASSDEALVKRFMERAKQSGFYPSHIETKPSIITDGISTSSNALVANLTEGDGKVDIARSTVKDTSTLMNASGKSGMISGHDMHLDGHSQVYNASNHSEGTAVALDAIRARKLQDPPK